MSVTPIRKEVKYSLNEIEKLKVENLLLKKQLLEQQYQFNVKALTAQIQQTLLEISRANDLSENLKFDFTQMGFVE